METLFTILRSVRDPRDFNARHDCGSMLFISVMATLCGAKSCVDIAEFAAAHATEMADIVDMPHDPPSHDSFSRLFRLLDPEELSHALSSFAKALRVALGLGAPAGGIVAVDGKRLRRGFERGRAHMPPLMISVWDAETRLSLAARASGDGNEVKAVLEALKSLDLKGCVVTADALHCHPAMAEGVRARGGHYALKLKGNNGPLLACAEATFEKGEKRGRLPVHETKERGHGRSEGRRACVVNAPAQANLPGIKMFGRIETERGRPDGTVARSVHYVALSQKTTPQRMMEIFRSHWSVENHLHRQLDVVFHEDDARSRKNHAAQNLSFIRRTALDILTAHPEKISVGRKMKKAAWSKDYFYSLFTHMR